MRIRPRTPALPMELFNQFGVPDRVWGPNLRFRIATVLLGSLLVLLGLLFVVGGLASKLANPQTRGSEGIMFLLGAGLLAVGIAAINFHFSTPLNWVFVFPGGIVRKLGHDWESLVWGEVLRFEDVSFAGTATVRQCRIIAIDGTEWGFLANLYEDYGSLKSILREKMKERSKESNLSK
jgi:hypothetical protein